VEHIEETAFAVMFEAGFTQFTISDNVTELRYYAFWNCQGLTEVYVPGPVQKKLDIPME